MEQIIRLWPEGPDLLADEACQKPGTDSVLLAGYAGPGQRIVDLGCGSGVVSLLLAHDRPQSRVTGIDFSEQACSLARRAAEKNGMQDRICILHADLRELRSLPAGGSFDCAVSNPPYFRPGSGAEARGERKSQRSQEGCSLSQLCRAAARLVRWGGNFSLVYRPEGLASLFGALCAARLEPKQLCLVRHHPGAPVSLVLVRCRHGGGPGLFIEELLLYDAQGRQTAEHCRYYHKEFKQ